MREEIKNTNKLGNKGFSLIELIIVIAIMAILIGIVGTQVVPYIETSKQAKDKQVFSSILTNATTAFANNAEEIDDTKSYKLTLADTISSDLPTKVSDKFYELAGLGTSDQWSNLKKKLKSKAANKATGIEIMRNADGVVTVKPLITDEKYKDAFDILSST